ncbi:MAG TPA: lysophospholipid acyltransferase family protein, partial [Nitrospiria bacterium]
RLTMRLEFRGTEKVDVFWKNGKNVIVAFWHSRQLMMPYAYSGPGKVNVLVSQHRDGELIAQTIAYFGMGALRGSTTRGGAAALRGLIRKAREGEDLGVTPDGPRGPRQVAQMGVIELAKLTGLPIIPLAFNASLKKKFLPGTNSLFPTPSAAGCIFGVIPSGSHGMRTAP